jgi:hypothetical protein
MTEPDHAALDGGAPVRRRTREDDPEASTQHHDESRQELVFVASARYAT